MNILFVCFGNISRSFLAEHLLRHNLKQTGAGGIAVSSVGLSAYPGNPPDPVMVKFLTTSGIPVSHHEAKPITSEDVDWADRILVMEEDHAAALRKMWPSASKKIEHLGRFIYGEDPPDDIMDPYGKSPYHYRLAQAQISTAVIALMKAVVGKAEVGK
jgi:protein-tyrosine phosphatase